MTKKLTLLLAVAILLMVSIFMGEGGPVDKFSGDATHGNLAVAEDQPSERAASDVKLAQTQTPAPPPIQPPADDDMWDWFGEAAPAAPPAPDMPPQPARQPSTPEVGALDRERMNLEE